MKSSVFISTEELQKVRKVKSVLLPELISYGKWTKGEAPKIPIICFKRLLPQSRSIYMLKPDP